MLLLLRRIKNIQYALVGLRYALFNDVSFRLEIILGIPIVALILIVRWPLSELDVVLVIGTYLLILITELQNSAIERALDQLHPEQHPAIGASKDMAAGAVFLAGCAALAVTIYIIVF